ncbi:MAG: sugar phosphate isomerase/epimerase [Lachnospiraceae bacterium]|nr:sugar phosphate isomerase/epimerase [Lachnospiraceae bacterium]
MLFGMPTLIEHKSLAEDVKLCERLGLAFVELNMNFPAYQIDKLENTAYFRAEAEKAGIFYSIHLEEGFDVANSNPLVSEAYLETMRRVIRVAKKLCELNPEDSPFIINMHLVHGVHITLPNGRVMIYDTNKEAYLKAFENFRNLVEEWIGNEKILVTVENNDGFTPYEMEAIDVLLKSSKFAMTWDIGHSKATGEADMPFLLKNWNRIVHFHVHDGKDNPPTNHLGLGDGDIDLQTRLEFAQKCNANCVLETKTADALEQSKTWLIGHNWA